ncbi:microcystin-dependent protein [Flavobacterium arsenatis]|uniref:Microcystin-dependent protein n=1 Tax=Flavobacterium arsenatis TaxID=1484332 RepID=A0ABU1TRL2_9FLAO|nr:tail fiber protein [Flavobacterium arsenatis]MDR6968509.1 microcystin-dependent protein [Flavobacterium arsenatis]
MDEFIGVIKIFAGTFAPRGWMLCQGQMLPISNNQALFSILGTNYGGDGITTFALPNLSGIVPIGTGNNPKSGTRYDLAEVGGSETTNLGIANIPAHKHNVTIHASSTNASYSQPIATSVLAAVGKPQGRDFEAFFGYTDATPDVQMSAAMATESPVGGGLPVANMQPFMAMNYIICMQGIYPSRP